MKIVTKVLLALLAIPVALLTVAIAVQTYYHLTPKTLSAEALGLNARAAKLPTVTENGYRLNGLLAPREQDAVVYGKCLLDAQEQHRREEKASGVKVPAYNDKALWAEYEKQSGTRFKALHDGCVKGGTLLSLPSLLTELRIKLDTTDDQWTVLAAAAPDEAVLARARAVRSGGARRLGADVDSPLPNYSSLMQLERWRIAKGVVAWRTGDRTRAVDMWAASIADWAKSANSTLIEAMLSTAAQTQVLTAVQSSVARSERIDDATAMSLLNALKPIETMPDSLAESMVGEWQMNVQMMTQVAEYPLLSPSLPGERNVFERAVARVAAWTFDVNDTTNALARANLWNQGAVREAALGREVAEYPRGALGFGCTDAGDWGMACLPFMRNPVGGILAAISLPMYPVYGTRVADLRNLAAATRLAIEARRRGLSGDALSQFVTTSPAEMRDVFTSSPFAYDAVHKRLRVQLRERTNFLGDKGPYELPL
jgi:hypothetical protein